MQGEAGQVCDEADIIKCLVELGGGYMGAHWKILPNFDDV